MAKSTKEELAAAKNYYLNNKKKRLDQQRIYRAAIKAKRAQNIANGRPPEEGIPESKRLDAHRKYNKKYKGQAKAPAKKAVKKKANKAESKAQDRKRKTEWARKNREQKVKEILEAYERDFGKKTG